MVLSHRFNEALSYAESLHREQKKRNQYSLCLTPSYCLIIGSRKWWQEDQAIAALLHDAVEDQGGESCLTEIRENTARLLLKS